jgi:hypothetical protein
MRAEELQFATTLMHDYPQIWAVCGGWAIDLYLGRVTRPHKDIDLAILRRDQLIAQRYMIERGWSLQIAHNGELSEWEAGKYLELPLHTIWCRKGDQFVELLLNESEGQHFLFRRDTTIQLKLYDAFLRTEDDIPFLAPEVVLLYKSNNPDQYRDDFYNTVQALSPQRLHWLWWAMARLYSEHEWLDVLNNYMAVE